ncbi:serine hydrolase [Sphaerisporangium krabiense]|uniref:D-alanyl-D-alanine carboxypeptidase n=1 Tax=Sphaerisporangium krabiense TaxID=763782 RepID=A0A7W8ZCM4_9ACTN|nr:serine hydrolase domain-containing protein [Sphaerisporangium krabiense]MBB5631532.1 D-alanyl-D-alanine carboxypeptidase [Sphaerisporangium krabiense]GII60946.1 serine hydrolase [Sphaerisporangium krabiense]
MRSRVPRVVTASALVVSLALAATPAVAAATPAAGRSDTTAQRARLQELARKLVDAGAPGVIVRVDDGRGRPVEIAAQAPWTRRDHLLTAADEYRMGSNTKTMMATLVLQLVAEGRLALADPVDKWLPGKVPGGTAITLRMLLNHTSGLFDYTKDAAMRRSMLGTDRRRWTSEKLLALGVKHAPLFAPGAKWSYSNTNYAAIGAVLERVTGASLADLVRDRIARPLGLEHTYFATDGTWRGTHAHGYEPDAAHMPPGVPAGFRHFAGPRRHGHVDVSGNDPGWGGAAGAVVSSTRDWSRFFTALMSGTLLPAAQLAQMRTTVPVDPRQPDGPGYGLGIQTGPHPCGTFWGHDGGIPGYLTVNVTDRAGGRTAMVLVATESWIEFETDPKIAEAAGALQTAAICAMFGKPAPAAG